MSDPITEVVARVKIDFYEKLVQLSLMPADQLKQRGFASFEEAVRHHLERAQAAIMRAVEP